MNCIEFEGWLDDGRPEARASQMNAHAAECGHCERSLRAAIDVERALGLVIPAVASADFNDGVMRKVRAIAEVGERPRALESWVGVVAEPLVAVSSAFAVGLAWQHKALLILVTRFSASAVSAIEGLLQAREMSAIAIGSPAAMNVLAIPAVTLGLALAAVPPILWTTWWILQGRQRG